MTVPCGERDTLFTIWTETATTGDASGQLVPSYVRKCNAWGKIQTAYPGPNSARIKGSQEGWEAYHVNVNAQWIVTIDYISGVVTTDQLTADIRGTTWTLNIAGPPLIDGGDLIIPTVEAT